MKDPQRLNNPAEDHSASLFLPDDSAQADTLNAREPYSLRDDFRDYELSHMLSGQEIDFSGEYNPKSGRRGPRQSSLEPLRRRRFDGDPDRPLGPRAPAIHTLQHGRFKGHRLCMTFYFSSFAAYTLLRNIGSQVPPGYFEWVNKEGETVVIDGDAGQSPKTTGGSRLRLRPQQTDVQSLNELRGVVLPSVGDPNYRSCLQCFVDVGGCSLIDDREVDPPCLSCFDDDQTCTPIDQIAEILPPCEGCIKKGLKCFNLRMHGDEVSRCERCVQDDEPRCPIPPQPSSEGPEGMQEPAVNSRKRPDDRSQYSVRLITTQFCHPISFNHDKKTPQDECFWCERPINGVKGLLKVEVTVKVFDNTALGYEEIEKGHAPWKPTTKMCRPCTSQRLRIMTCTKHRLEKFSSPINNNSFSQRKAKNAAQAGGPMHVGFWCMICDHVADFRCTTDDKAVKAAGPKTPTRCKLALCWKCSLHYMNMGMDLELAVRNRYMIEDRIVRNKRGEILSEEKTIIRADAGFLSKDGEMWSQVMKPKLNALEQSAGGASSPEQT